LRLRLVEAIADDIVRFFGGKSSVLAVSWERLRIMAYQCAKIILKPWE
jgi:hypothetical protein